MIEGKLNNRSITTDTELGIIGKKIKGFKGVNAPLSKLKNNGDSLIYNSGNHWLAVYRHKGDNYAFDSFGRSNMVPGTINFDSTQNQLNNETNCGQRSLALLTNLKKYGFDEVRQIYNYYKV